MIETKEVVTIRKYKPRDLAKILNLPEDAKVIFSTDVVDNLIIVEIREEINEKS